jgi:CubicO group peptidase (beta-lactamase class C family)
LRGCDDVIDRAIAGEKVVGLVFVAARDGEIIYERAAGYADREAGTPAKGDTLFRLASLTKLIVSAAALALVEEGVLYLDDAVRTWLPEFTPALPDGRVPTIAIRHLLSHTAGLSYRQNEDGDGPYHRANVSDGTDQPGLSIEENLRRIASVPLLFEPGTQWAYSVAHDVLGELLARATHESLPQLVRRTVLHPLHADDTAFEIIDKTRLATPYADGNPRPQRMNEALHVVALQGKQTLDLSPARAFDATSYPSGGVGLIGTASEFTRLLEALRTNGAPILAQNSARQITSNQIGDVSARGRGEGWRFGFGTSILGGAAAREAHLASGSWRWGGVYGNCYWVDPQRGMSAVLLTNTAVAGMTGDLPNALRDALRE